MIDRNRITAGGITSGIDFGIRVVEERCGREMAEQIVLSLEYDPAPTSEGLPETARPEIVEKARTWISTRNADGGHSARIDQAAAEFVAA